MIPPRYARDFLQDQALELPHDRTPRGPRSEHPESLDLFLRFAARSYRSQAIAALELGLGADAARRCLAEAARAWVEYATRVPEAISPSDAETAFGACGVSNRAASERFARAYLATPSGQGKDIDGSDERHWACVGEAMARHWVGDAAGAAKAMAGLGKLGPFKRGPHGAAWWKSLEALAKECLFAKKPDPTALLAAFAEDTEKQLGRAWKSDRATEALFNDRALAFAAVARDRGWILPAADPAPTIPLELFRLPPAAIPERPFNEWPAPDPALVAAVSAAAATPAKPIEEKPTANGAAAKKPAAKKPPAKKPAPARKKSK